MEIQSKYKFKALVYECNKKLVLFMEEKPTYCIDRAI